MKAIRFHQFGAPAQVLTVEDIPQPEPAADEVLVRLTARSVNPSDLYTVMGTYGIRPKLPATAGNEGAGVVERVGADVTNFKPGDRVTVLPGATGTWCEYVTLKPAALLPTPPSLSDEQAACAWVNYLTAWILALEELDLQADEPVLVTAGASHLGRAMLQLAQHSGFKVVATVRRAEQRQELLDAGALGVIATDSDDIAKAWHAITGRKGIHKVIDAVGGATGSAILEALAPRATFILYGLMSQQPLQIGGQLIFSEAVIRGFWLVRWFQQRTPEHVASVFGQIGQLFANGTLNPVIDSTFDLDDVSGMVERSLAPGRQGKVIITGPQQPAS